VGPECNGFLAFAEDEDMALADSCVRQPRKAVLDQPSCNTAPGICRGDGKMMKIPAPTVMTAKDGADDFPVGFGDSAQVDERS
jgi:hypothetical protein